MPESGRHSRGVICATTRSSPIRSSPTRSSPHDARGYETTRCEISPILVAPELPVGEARQVERPDPELMPGELALGIVNDAAVQA